MWICALYRLELRYEVRQCGLIAVSVAGYVGRRGKEVLSCLRRELQIKLVSTLQIGSVNPMVDFDTDPYMRQ
jgi:hypothetical protein